MWRSVKAVSGGFVRIWVIQLNVRLAVYERNAAAPLDGVYPATSMVVLSVRVRARQNI